jgi:aspartyl/asparaginyl beta-hydroxylase (cupin superfamily)
MIASGFLDPAAFPCARWLEQRHEALAADLSALRDDEFVRWIVDAAYFGDWRVFGVYHCRSGFVLRSHLSEHDPDPRLARTRAVVQRIPGLFAAGFSFLAPRSHILPHTDEQIVRTLRFHLGLVTDPGARIRVCGEVRSWERGRVLVLDSAAEHEVVHEGTRPRIIFIAEVELARAAEPLLPEPPRAAARGAG